MKSIIADPKSSNLEKSDAIELTKYFINKHYKEKFGNKVILILCPKKALLQ